MSCRKNVARETLLSFVLSNTLKAKKKKKRKRKEEEEEEETKGKDRKGDDRSVKFCCYFRFDDAQRTK